MNYKTDWKSGDRYEDEVERVIYKGIIFRSTLEATWAAFFDSVVHKWEYEPKTDLFCGWVPDFAVWVRAGDAPVYCEVKPIWLMSLPYNIADKISCSENYSPQNNAAMTAILGTEAPQRCQGIYSLGWISLRRSEGIRKWLPFSVGNKDLIEYHWKLAQNTIKGLKAWVTPLDEIFSRIYLDHEPIAEGTTLKPLSDEKMQKRLPKDVSTWI